MERHLQETRNNGTVITGIWDNKFAPSTIQRREPMAGSNALAARDSRVSNLKAAQTKPKSGFKPPWPEEDEDTDSSCDEIDMLSRASKVKNHVAKSKAAFQPVAKSKVAEKRTNISPKRPAKRPPQAKTSKGHESTPDSGDDPIASPLPRLVAEKVTSKKTKPPPRVKPAATAKAKKQGGQKPKVDPAFDVREITDSDAENTTDAPTNPAPARYEPRPFPMDLSDTPLTGSSRAPSSMPAVVSTRNKPTTSARSQARKNQIESSESSDSDSVGAEFTYTQAVRLSEADPNTLCPFCDDKLPDEPSETLRAMLEKLKRKAKPDPRYGNSLGLKLDMTQYISFCARHTAESEEFPKGKKYGWPSTLNAPKLTKRIWKLQPQLQAIIDDPDEGTFFRPLQETALKYGKSAVTGAKGSWATFENASTGYYGEQGLALITQVLFDMFPTIPGEKISPLELSNYYSLVLVPEVALLLIQADLQKKKGDEDEAVTRSQALKTLRKSTKYGLAFFPIADGDKANLGDDIVRERARKMRKIRDQEEEEELSRTSSQNTDQGIVLDLSSDDSMDNQKTPVPKKRRAQKPPHSDLGATPKTVKKRAHEDFQKKLDTPLPAIERKVSKKVNLNSQPGALGQWSNASTAASVHKKESWSWLLDS